MKKQKIRFNLGSARFLIVFVFLLPIAAQDLVVKKTQNLLLGETFVKINVYEKKGASITFFAPHYNEQIGTKIAKELIGKNGGRVVEIESLDENGQPARRLRFSIQGKSYSVDPNRIYTENGRRCGENYSEINETVKNFAVNLLKIILASDGSNRLRSGEKFLVAVHNNKDVDAAASPEAKAQDLTSYSFVRAGKIPLALTGEYQDQVDGVFLSNVEMDEDNFFFLSMPAFLGFFAGKGFNAILQKFPAKLQTEDCRVDDGSLSVFAGQRNIPYINVEADAFSGEYRQREMLEAVYELLQKSGKSQSNLTAAAENGEAADQQ